MSAIVETVLNLGYCCQVDDMNSPTVRCPRTWGTYMLQNLAEDIRQSRKRADRLRSEWRKKNLTEWCEDAEGRLQRLFDRLQECESGNPDRFTREEMMPGCTC
ncbi:hypothetical protein ACIF83_10245 [Streptomyces sp. NPDC085866]|uniref:hypothetical protein n=1 Tax=Streptomyces sp. NPDC085866 TaxID=3365736 RepID=UPI0037D6EC13